MQCDALDYWITQSTTIRAVRIVAIPCSCDCISEELICMRGLAFHWRCNKKNQIRVSAANCHINTGCAGHGESDADRDANDQLDGITRQSATSVQIVAFAFGPKQSLLWSLQFLANQSVVLTNRRPILASPQLCIYGAYVSSS